MGQIFSTEYSLPEMNFTSNALKLSKSPVPHLLHTNQSPSLEEEILILDVILAAEEELQVLEDPDHPGHAHRQTWLTEKEIDVVTAHLNSFVEQHRAILAPIHRLPPEILQYTFQILADSQSSELFLGVSVGVDDRDAGTPSASGNFWAISRVSRRWRENSLVVPDLWANIPRLKLYSAVSTRYTQRQILLVSSLLLRCSSSSSDSKLKAAPAAVGISFNLDLTDLEPADAAHHPIVHLLEAHSERWRSACLFGNTWTVLSAFASIRGRLGALEELHLNLADEEYSAQLDMFEEAPRLRRVRLAGKVFRRPAFSSTRKVELVDELER